VIRGGEIAHGVQCARISFEEHLFGVFAEQLAQSRVHGLLLGSAYIFADPLAGSHCGCTLRVEGFLTGVFMRSNEYMSIEFPDFPTLRREFWSEMFGSGIQDLREKRGRSVEEAAALAAMDPQDWAALEAGHAPERPEELHRIAAGLGLKVADLATLVIFCQDAWH
jgi:hypothetical protein